MSTTVMAVEKLKAGMVTLSSEMSVIKKVARKLQTDNMVKARELFASLSPISREYVASTVGQEIATELRDSSDPLIMRIPKGSVVQWPGRAPMKATEDMVLVDAKKAREMMRKLGLKPPYPKTYEELDRRLKALGK